jgi:hypothetical protein
MLRGFLPITAYQESKCLHDKDDDDDSDDDEMMVTMMIKMMMVMIMMNYDVIIQCK